MAEVRGSVLKYSSALHVFSINSLCFVSMFSLKGIISNGILWSGLIDLLVRPDHFMGDRKPRDTGITILQMLQLKRASSQNVTFGGLL